MTEKDYRFIPYRKRDIIEMCLEEKQLPGQEKLFTDLYYMLSSIFHFEFHKVIESLKDSYAAIDPDADTREFKQSKLLTDLDFVELLDGLLEKANYERVTEDDLNQALNESSLFKIKLHVDFDDFSEVLLFYRGESTKQQTVKTWFGLKTKDIEFTNFERVVVYIRFKEQEQDEVSQSSPSALKPGSTLLKLFQNVPKADLEMLFPNTKVKMRLIDKVLIGIPAIISGGIVITTKLGASVILIASLFGFWFGLNSQPVELNQTAIITLFAGVAALGGYFWKQFSSFKNRKLQFMQSLTQNLYFKNLDNNAGVFHRLANDAEEEECKEAILAYYFLLTSDIALTRKALDTKIEHWFLSKWDCKIDFEIDDALNKLIALNLIKLNGETLQAVSLEKSLQILDQRWDDYFKPN
ncbi:MAG: hypothetical protein ACI9N9_002547 [Enterobacterales bacterium]